ncbi:MAG: HNH endonuclease signature motif containing protein [Nitrospira sp.]|nr:HNH endonuclease signature motif containing protein [Nitrospira sp.]
MPNFHETQPNQHTPDAALTEVLLWLGRTPSVLADVILCTLPGRLHRSQEQELYDELYRVLSDTGSLWVWGSNAGLFGSRFEMQLIAGDLTHAWGGWERPLLREDVRPPSFGTMSREMPPSIVEYALRATGSAPGRLVLDIFPRAPHVSQKVGRDIGARVLTVGCVSDLYAAHATAPGFVRDKFFADWFLQVLEKSGKCLVWPGKPNGAGYARLKIGGEEWYAHRVSWMLSHRRAIPEGMEVGHAGCADKRCCAPAHLRLVTRIGNLDERWVGKRLEA